MANEEHQNKRGRINYRFLLRLLGRGNIEHDIHVVDLSKPITGKLVYIFLNSDKCSIKWHDASETIVNFKALNEFEIYCDLQI